MAFSPIFPSHSIERCSLTFVFDQNLPTKPFQKILELAEPSFKNAGLEKSAGMAVGFQIDTATGRATPISGPGSGPSHFVTADRTTGVLITPQMIQLETARYVRWRPFVGQFEELLLPVIDRFCENLSLLSVQLNYTDVYLWSGDWSGFNWREVLNSESGLIASRPSRAQQHWHTHTGWFEGITENFRRLVSANIDIIDRLQNAGEPAIPAVSVITSCRDEMFAPLGQPIGGGLDAETILARLEDIHNRLKSLLKDIITTQMAERVGL